MLKTLGAAALATRLTSPLFALGTSPYTLGYQLTREEEAFLDQLQRRGAAFFWEHGSPVSGQVLDRSRAAGPDTRRIASIAATGFGLTALCIAHSRGYMPRADIVNRVRATLRFHAEKMPHEHGFFFHMSDIDTGIPTDRSEVSPIDTSLLLCGILTCRAYFKDAEIHELASKIYERVDWPWMLNDGKAFAMSWTRDSGFKPRRWDNYSEEMMMYLLGIGSTTHPIDPDCWNHFDRPEFEYEGLHYISHGAPLFIHQYSHAWYDFRHKRDGYADYFANSVVATRAHKLFCLSMKENYSEDFWGITASDYVGKNGVGHGYTAWGGPPAKGPIDGTVVPCAAAGSLPFLPKDCLNVLISMKKKYEAQAWGRYGFVDAFNPRLPWYDQDVLGIDQGISVAMAENLRSGFVWETFMRNPEAPAAMENCGFFAV
jgi:hypothetical protein